LETVDRSVRPQARVGKLVGAHVDLDVPEREIVRQGSGRHRESQPAK
jgi:hypothetical protein